MYTLGPALRIPDVKNMGKDLAPEELRISPSEALTATPEEPAPTPRESVRDPLKGTRLMGLSMRCPDAWPHHWL